MPYGKYRNTAIVSYEIGDALEGLQYTGYLSPDIETAARIAPLQFNPRTENMLFERHNWWKTSHIQANTAAVQVMKRFNGWYQGQARPVHKAYLSLISIMTGYQFVDEIVDQAARVLAEMFRTTIVDADDTISTITDRVRMIEPGNVEDVFNTPAGQATIVALQGMFDRIQAAPAVSLPLIQEWHEHNVRFQSRVFEEHHDNIFQRTGVKPGRAAKVLAKSYDLLQTFYGRATARKFLHGDAIHIEAQHLVWGIRLLPHASIIQNTIDPSSAHTPFEIIIYSRDGNRLCNGCVLWPGTPVFDQAVGFKLATADPDEELELLMQTNISCVTPAGREHPLLQHKFKDGDNWLDAVPLLPACQTIDGFLRRNSIWDEDDVEENTQAVMRRVINLDDIIPRGAIQEIIEPVEWITSVSVDGVVEGESDSDETEDEVLDIDDPDFATRYERMVDLRRSHSRAQRQQNEVVKRVQAELFRRVHVPADVLDCVMHPADHYWIPKNITEDALPCRVARYITEKRFDN